MDIYSLCKKHTNLSDNDILKLKEISQTLPLMADVTNCDVFINCMDVHRGIAVVIAQSEPTGNESSYEHSVVGTDALRKNEPAVYEAFENGVTTRDLKAITQEGVSVKQDVVPIKNDSGDIIAVLIREKDISHFLRNDKKLALLIKENDSPEKRNVVGDNINELINIREVHHRVKNNLQMIISIMNLQIRRSKNEEVITTLKEHIQRVMSIATIHEILVGEEADEGISLQFLLEKMCRNIRVVSSGDKIININTTGDDMQVSSDLSTSIAIVVNELISNAIEHGYAGRNEGTVNVNVSVGNLYATITVEDFGCGYSMPTLKSQNSLGLELVSLMVKDKLDGVFRVVSKEIGTKAIFTIKI